MSIINHKSHNYRCARIVMELHLKKLLDQVKNAIWLKHYAYCNEKIHVQWIRRYIFVPQQGKSLELWDCL